jgi:hypothetical protein
MAAQMPALERSASLTPQLALPPSLEHTPSTASVVGGNGGGTNNNNGGNGVAEWRSFVAIEERQAVRHKLRESFKQRCATYDELLAMVVAVDEEIVFSASANKMEYLRTAIAWDSRLAIKAKQLQGETTLSALPSSTATSTATSDSAVAAASASASAANGKKRKHVEDDVVEGVDKQTNARGTAKRSARGKQ